MNYSDQIMIGKKAYSLTRDYLLGFLDYCVSAEILSHYLNICTGLIRIFHGIGLCPVKSAGFQLFNCITRVAEHNRGNAYHTDKLFWLIGSGYFFDHKEISKRGRIKTNRDEFVQWALGKLP